MESMLTTILRLVTTILNLAASLSFGKTRAPDRAPFGCESVSKVLCEVVLLSGLLGLLGLFAKVTSHPAVAGPMIHRCFA